MSSYQGDKGHNVSQPYFCEPLCSWCEDGYMAPEGLYRRHFCICVHRCSSVAFYFPSEGSRYRGTFSLLCKSWSKPLMNAERVMPVRLCLILPPARDEIGTERMKRKARRISRSRNSQRAWSKSGYKSTNLEKAANLCVFSIQKVTRNPGFVIKPEAGMPL